MIIGSAVRETYPSLTEPRISYEHEKNHLDDHGLVAYCAGLQFDRALCGA